MADSFETCRDYRATNPLFFLKIIELCDILHRFYESLNEKNRICELCTFSQISHIYVCSYVVAPAAHYTIKTEALHRVSNVQLIEVFY